MSVELRGVHHVGVPVRSLERSLAFYRDMFGVEPTFQVESEGPEVDANLQLEGAKVSAAFVPLGNTILELLEYQNPVGEDFALRNCDVGAIHVALDVADIDAAYEELRAKGADFSSAPTVIPEGELEGYRFCYFRDHDGIQFELFEAPR
jgi:catechol 2,3-dioxygenase-like lactoylglutathione lyase family enzyme